MCLCMGSGQFNSFVLHRWLYLNTFHGLRHVYSIKLFTSKIRTKTHTFCLEGLDRLETPAIAFM